MNEKNNPQLEDGYIKIANEIWKELGHYRLSGEEWLVLNCILAKTYGWNKKEDRISFGQFSKYTGLARPNVSRTINKLLSKKIIGVIKKDNSKGNLYYFNKLYGQWESVIKKDNTSKSVIKKDNRVLSKKITKVLSKKITTKYNKDTITKNNIHDSENRAQKINKIFKKQKCPLVINYGEGKHSLCVEFLDELAKMKNLPHGWISMPKQIGILHKLIKIGYTREDMRIIAKELDEDKFMWDKWDMATIASTLEKKGKEVIIRAKH